MNKFELHFFLQSKLTVKLSNDLLLPFSICILDSSIKILVKSKYLKNMIHRKLVIDNRATDSSEMYS